MEERVISKGSVYDLFFYSANLNKGKIAIIYGNYNVTYEQFLIDINKVAFTLLEKGFNKKHIIAIALPPSYQFLLYMFACLKLHITYIPLNVDYPWDYIETILKDANIAALISRSSLIKDKSNFNFIDVDYLSESSLANDIASITSYVENPAYIIYTSGSTGSPKGVMMHHDNLISLIMATRNLFKIDDCDVIPLFHSLAFDLSVWEICSALLHGAKLVIVPNEIKQSVEEYCTFLINYHVSMLTLTPSMLYLIQDALAKQPLNSLNRVNLKYVISAGEPLYPIKLKRWFDLPIAEKVALYNMYGITEGTIHSTVKKINKEDSLKSVSPIGIPLSNVDIIVVDENNEVINGNEIGELCLSGAAITKGYLNDAELNEISFFTKSSAEGKEKRYFKTKDLVKKSSNGEFEFIERKNNVLKIKGFRISVSEIENLLIQCEDIDNAVISTFQASDNAPRLVAYLQGDRNLIDVISIKKFLREKLPDFMCPSRFIVIDKIPLTINGKIDIEALSKIHQNYLATADIEPSISIEGLVKRAWQQVLNQSNVDLEENFFDAGGDSLLLARLFFILKENLDQRIELADLIKYPSIKQFSTFVKNCFMSV